MVRNSVIVWIFMGMDLRGTEFHSCADFRGVEFRSCADFHRHIFAGFRTCAELQGYESPYLSKVQVVSGSKNLFVCL